MTGTGRGITEAEKRGHSHQPGTLLGHTWLWPGSSPWQAFILSRSSFLLSDPFSLCLYLLKTSWSTASPVFNHEFPLALSEEKF